MTTIYAICTEEGMLLQPLTFRDPELARRFFEVEAERNWRAIIAADGLSEAHLPTLEWHEIEPPHWASPDALALAGMTGDAENPVIIAGLILEERALA